MHGHPSTLGDSFTSLKLSSPPPNFARAGFGWLRFELSSLKENCLLTKVSPEHNPTNNYILVEGCIEIKGNLCTQFKLV